MIPLQNVSSRRGTASLRRPPVILSVYGSGGQQTGGAQIGQQRVELRHYICFTRCIGNSRGWRDSTGRTCRAGGTGGAFCSGCAGGSFRTGRTRRASGTSGADRTGRTGFTSGSRRTYWAGGTGRAGCSGCASGSCGARRASGDSRLYATICCTMRRYGSAKSNAMSMLLSSWT